MEAPEDGWTGRRFPKILPKGLDRLRNALYYRGMATETTPSATPNGLTASQVYDLAFYFAAHEDVSGVYLWEDGTLHNEPRPGADLAFWVSRDAALRYSRRGDWQGEVEFLDKLQEEDEAYAKVWEMPEGLAARLTAQPSKGHICFHGDFEFFERPDGDVYRAKIADVIMTDGYRFGRWECSRAHFERFRSVILPSLALPVADQPVEVESNPVAVPAVPASPICYGQVNQGTWCQEWYETASKDAGLRARALRKLGYVCRAQAEGPQVTGVGVVKMTLLDIRPGTNPDTANLPKVRIERIWGER